ncbi:MAG: 16S rRNA (guanine(527)-N(7))-methyltransferase RsmG [Erysipelotrichia bacterium]|nr:16S rRNA (guanine(527)-N(7))-methyltransferase RsmG [Erysipelotrichia bacterium]
MDKITLVNELKKRAIKVSDLQLSQLWDFMTHVLKTNELFNLTAITNEGAFVEKMIFDSASALYGQNYDQKDILDIGTGAGFPSVVLAILSPTSRVYALDSTAKKVEFIKQYAIKNNLPITTINARAEDYAKDHREQFDYVIARAVAPLRVLMELAVPSLKVGGHFIAMKGPNYENEIKEAVGALKTLHCAIDYIYEDVLPLSEENRALIFIKKIDKTPHKYPRLYADIKNKAL